MAVIFINKFANVKVIHNLIVCFPLVVIYLHIYQNRSNSQAHAQILLTRAWMVIHLPLKLFGRVEPRRELIVSTAAEARPLLGKDLRSPLRACNRSQINGHFSARMSSSAEHMACNSSTSARNSAMSICNSRSSSLSVPVSSTSDGILGLT